MADDQCSTIVPLSPDAHGIHIPAVLFPRRSLISSNVLLPKSIYIRNRHGSYLTVRDDHHYNGNLTFQSGEPEPSCLFETKKPYGTTDHRYSFIRWNGDYIARFNDTHPPFWYYVQNHNAPHLYTILAARDSIVYIKDGSNNVICSQMTETGAPTGRDFINQDSEMEIIMASVKNDIFDVEYDITGGIVREAPPLIALSTAVRNDSDGDVNQTLTYTYEKWAVGTWNNSLGVEIGGKTSFKAGVPFVTSAEFEIAISGSYSHEWGGEEGVRQSITSSTTVTVPPKKKARATIIVRNALIDVAFTYTQRTVWANGVSEDQRKNGIYNNVDSWHVDVVLDGWENI